MTIVPANRLGCDNHSDTGWYEDDHMFGALKFPPRDLRKMCCARGGICARSLSSCGYAFGGDSSLPTRHVSNQHALFLSSNRRTYARGHGGPP